MNLARLLSTGLAQLLVRANTSFVRQPTQNLATLERKGWPVELAHRGGAECAMWRILASLFGPETTLKRHQCVTVLAQNDTGILTTAKNPDSTGA